jgi:hypothetical protein
VVAYGTIKLMAEAILVTNKDLSQYMRASAIKGLFEIAGNICRDHHVDELHAFTNDERYAEFLVSHLKFREIKEKALSVNLQR